MLHFTSAPLSAQLCRFSTLCSTLPVLHFELYIVLHFTGPPLWRYSTLSLSSCAQLCRCSTLCSTLPELHLVLNIAGSSLCALHFAPLYQSSTMAVLNSVTLCSTLPVFYFVLNFASAPLCAPLCRFSTLGSTLPVFCIVSPTAFVPRENI